MAENKKEFGYKKVFGFVLPVWVNEKVLSRLVSYFLVFVVMLVALLFYVIPGIKNVELLKTKLELAKSQLSSLKNSKLGLDETTGDLKASDIKVLFKAMPIGYEPDKIISSIRKVAKESDVAITSYSLPQGGLEVAGSNNEVDSKSETNKKASSVITSIPVKLSVSGNSDAVLNFVRRLDSSLPVGEVSDLALQELTQETRRAGTSLQLQLTVNYFRPNPRKVDLSELRRFTIDELALIDELSGYISDLTGSKTATASSFFQNRTVSDLFGF